MRKEQFSGIVVLFVLAFMIYFIPGIFLSGTDYAAWGYFALLLSLSLAHTGLLAKRVYLNVPVSMLLAIQSAYCLYEGVGTKPLLSVCLLLCLLAAILSIKGSAERAVHDRHVLVQSFFIFLTTASILLASIVEFVEPDVIILCQTYMFGIVGLMLIEVLFKLPSYILMSYLSMCAAYYVYLYVRIAPFSYPFWLVTLVVNVLFLAYAMYYYFTQFSLQTNDVESNN